MTGIGNTEVQVDLGTKHAGYIPYDEVSTDPSVKPEDILKVGDEIEVFVVRVNDQEGTVQLSKKKLDGLKVWDDIEAAWAENKTTVEGTITEENKGGLVANVKGIRVFIPASQSGIAKGGDMAGMVGKTVQLKITEVNRARRRVIGSIRAVNCRGSQGCAGEDLVRDRSGQEVPRHRQVPDFLRRVRGHRRCGRHGSRFRAELEPHQDSR